MRRALVGSACVLALVAGALVLQSRQHGFPTPGAAIGAVAPLLASSAGPAARTLKPYDGFGAWVDGFDFGAAYTPAGAAPAITPAVVDDLAAHGVKTLFLQAARDDTRSPGGLVDPAVAADILVRAHRKGIAVVAWYLPRFRSPDLDLAYLRKLDAFDVLGHRYDGVAVDIEYTADVPDTAERNRRLLTLSHDLRASVGSDPLGAIVLPPVQTEVINPQLWPDFPWSELSSLYDAWMPMSYWTFRSEASGYADGFAYNEESTRRLRNNLGNQSAVVHGIGGIGDLVTPQTLGAFAASLVATHSVGGSIYDWASMTKANRDAIAAAFRGSGDAARLPRGPSG